MKIIEIIKIAGLIVFMALSVDISKKIGEAIKRKSSKLFRYIFISFIAVFIISVVVLVYFLLSRNVLKVYLVFIMVISYTFLRFNRERFQ